MKRIHFIGRAVIIENDHLLLCHKIGADYVYLPGGHIEFGESARDAIARECEEEFGEFAEVGAFVCALEHAFETPKRQQHELNLIFEASLPTTRFPANPVSLESHLEFYWRPIHRLHELTLWPAPVTDIVASLNDKNTPLSVPFISTIEPDPRR